MAIYPQVIFEVKINNVWEDLTKDVISSQDCQYGILGNNWNDRVATTGTLRFTLRNDDKCSGGYENYYLPGSAHAKTGWRKRIPIRLRFIYAGTSITKFYGHITDIKINAENKTVDVLAADFMDYAATYSLSLPTIQYDKDISEVVQAVISGMQNQPLNTVYNSGQDIFPTAFDTVNDKTKALSEFQKVALSELGYVYIKHYLAADETLVVEGRHTRNQLNEVSRIPITDGFWLWEDGSYILWEDGSKILLDSAEDAVLTNKAISLNVTYGDNLANQVLIKAYPRTVATGYTVLFSLGSPIYLAPNETKANVTANYSDSSANKVAASDVIIPVAYTDYEFYTNSDGTGLDMTSYLTVTPSFGANGASLTLTNTSFTLGAYITKLQIRGKAIYLYDTVTYTAEDATSIAENDVVPLSLDMKYQNLVENAVTFGELILSKDKDARTVVNSINFIANSHEQLLYAFLYLDIGDLVHIVDTKNDIDSSYYIQGVKFNLQPAGLINFTWNVIEAIQLEENYWMLEVAGYSELGSTTVLAY